MNSSYQIFTQKAIKNKGKQLERFDDLDKQKYIYIYAYIYI